MSNDHADAASLSGWLLLAAAFALTFVAHGSIAKAVRDLPAARFFVGELVCVPAPIVMRAGEAVLVVPDGVHEIRNIDWTWSTGSMVYDLGPVGRFPIDALEHPGAATLRLDACDLATRV